MSTAPLGLCLVWVRSPKPTDFEHLLCIQGTARLSSIVQGSCHGCRAADWDGRIVDETVSWVGRRSPEQTGTAESVI